METTKPTPQQVRDYMTERRTSATPPPTSARVRELLGWHMLPNNRK